MDDIVLPIECRQCSSDLETTFARAQVYCTPEQTHVFLPPGSGQARVEIRKKSKVQKRAFASTADVLCGTCGTKVGAVNNSLCPDPTNDDAFALLKAKMVNIGGVSVSSWSDARNSGRIGHLKTVHQTLVKVRNNDMMMSNLKMDLPDTIRVQREAQVPKLLVPTPREYQEEVFKRVMETDKNAFVVLPTGMGKTLLASMFLERMLEFNPQRKGLFIVETNALASQQSVALHRETKRGVFWLQSGTFSGPTNTESALTKVATDLRMNSIVVATAGILVHAVRTVRHTHTSRACKYLNSVSDSLFVL